jgi:hypothetical protein
MGYSQSWLAVKGKTPAAVLEVLGLRGTGTHEEIAESPLVGAGLPSGWYLVVTDRSGHPLTRDTVLQRLSAGCEVVTGDVEEHVMVSVATGWKDGQSVWSVVHDAQRDMEHLETQGDLPAAFGGIRDKLLSKQQAAGGRKTDVDYIFDVPVELAQSLTGYRHDADIPGVGDHPFEVLTQTSAGSSASGPRPSFFRRLFGG